MTLTIVSTRQRPDLVEITARWRWAEFYRAEGTPFEEVLAGAQETAASREAMPQTLVLLADGRPVGTASLTAQDMEERPELSPWLAGVVVAPEARGRGYAGMLVTGVETLAAFHAIRTLWLYTRRSERIYARAGWTTVERVRRGEKEYAVMRHDLDWQE